jgi:hypothetical protein
MQTLDLMLDSARRHVRANAEDVAAWGRVNGIDLHVAVPLVAGLVSRVVSIYSGMEAADRLFRRDVGTRGPDLAGRAELVRDGFAAYVGLVDATFRMVTQLPADAWPTAASMTELRRVREAAAELASVYQGEVEFFRGHPGVSWEDLRKTLGV